MSALGLEGHGARKNRRSVWGYSPAIAATNTLIGTTNIAVPHRPAAATAVEAISGDADDTAAGAGARTILVWGLDANFKPITATISMNGLTVTAATTEEFTRVFGAYVVTSGTINAGNQGAILVRVESAGATFVTIPATEGASSSAHYCTGPKETFYLHDVHLTADATKVVNFSLWTQPNADDVTIPFPAPLVLRKYSGVADDVDLEYDPDLFIPPLTDIWITGTATAGGGLGSAELNGFIGIGG